MTRILGIDPGLTRTGWGIIDYQDNRLNYIACGVIATKPSDAIARRLSMHHRGLSEVIARHRPQEAALEETFVNMNGASTLKLGQARGAILLSLCLSGLEVGEYATNLVKKSITGNGHADKTQIIRMVQMLLPACRETSADACDALAVAICHAHHRMRVMSDE